MAEAVALQVQPQNALTSIGQIMGIANSAIDLRRNQGTVEADIAKRGSESRQQLGTEKPTIEKATAEAERANIAKNLEQFKLTGEYAQRARDFQTSLTQDPDVVNGNADGIIAKLKSHRDEMIAAGVPASVAEVQTAHAIQEAASNPKGFRQRLLNLTQAGMGATGQATQNMVPASQQQQVGVNPTTNAQQTVTRTQTGDVSVSPITAAPGLQAQEKPAKDALGNPAIEVVAPDGKISYKAPPGSNTPPLMALPPGETPDTAKPLMALRDTTNRAAAEVPAQRFNNAQIIKLAPSAFTGTGGDTFAKILGSVGIQATNNMAADTASLNHFLALQTENNAKAMGANTDAARQIATTAAGSAKSPEQAIIRIAKINDAYATGLDLFNRGMEAAIKNPANDKSIFAARDFQNQWAQTFDPVAMQLHNAIQAKNGATNVREQRAAQQDIEDIVKAAGGKGSAGAAALAKRYQAIEKLATEGR